MRRHPTATRSCCSAYPPNVTVHGPPALPVTVTLSILLERIQRGVHLRGRGIVGQGRGHIACKRQPERAARGIAERDRLHFVRATTALRVRGLDLRLAAHRPHVRRVDRGLHQIRTAQCALERQLPFLGGGGVLELGHHDVAGCNIVERFECGLHLGGRGIVGDRRCRLAIVTERERAAGDEHGRDAHTLHFIGRTALRGRGDRERRDGIGIAAPFFARQLPQEVIAELEHAAIAIAQAGQVAQRVDTDTSATDCPRSFRSSAGPVRRRHTWCRCPPDR